MTRTTAHKVGAQEMQTSQHGGFVELEVKVNEDDDDAC